MEQGIELIVRALIIREKKILVCQTDGKQYFFLPGGHVEFGENMGEALRREIDEELGAKVTGSKFIGSIGNIFVQEGVKRHEVSYVFLTDIDVENVQSKETHIEFYWFAIEEFIEQNIAPPALKDAILQWTAEKEIFFIEEKSDGRS